MNRTEAQAKLAVLHQTQLLQNWETLSEVQRQHLLAQIADLDSAVFVEQQRLFQLNSPPVHSLEPFDTPIHSGNPQDKQVGEQLIKEGKMGCLIVAGGQGTRLNFDGPKGMFPLTSIRHKTLFQLFAEKTLAASKKAGRPLPLAIMTSTLNHQATLDYFEAHHFFGLSMEQLHFFPQKNLPFLDPQGQLFQEVPGNLAEGPDGNGDALRQFYRSGIWEAWAAQGVRFLNFVPIDNPLADPFDAELLGCHSRLKGDIVIKCTTRTNPHENVGILVHEHGKLRVLEYFEIPEAERTASTSQSTLRYPCANLSLFSFSMDFIGTKAATAALPLHKVLKPLKPPAQTMAWRFERFIFDILPYADKVAALLYPREECFAPLKNTAHIEEVKRALQSRDRQILESITGQPCGEGPLEIAQEFYYPTPELLAEWHGRKLLNGGYTGI